MRELRNCNEIVKMDSRTVEGYALVFGKQSRDNRTYSLRRYIRKV